MTIRVRPIRLAKWFPPHDPVATMVAVLCVLREDLLLELFGITNERIDRLDDNDAGYRRFYFWRNSLRTLEEIKKVLTRLSFQTAFVDAMAREPEDIRAAYEQVKNELNTAHKEFLKGLRDTIGGHVADQIFQTMLNKLDPFGEEAFHQEGDIRGKIHYRFAADLLWESVLQNVPHGKRLEKVEELLGRTSSLTKLVKTIDDVFICYAHSRRLP